ncbi:hypothetical protein WS67_04925 [Burkholderia singularis]|uniref:Uncharacterized protein n=1 Tax=Burkholderia singularis TaxID=1503053 RepID=A0A103E701_9BURK|nr:hypothetical protein WS67_04925 [Burkholderia singularis]
MRQRYVFGYIPCNRADMQDSPPNGLGATCVNVGITGPLARRLEDGRRAGAPTDVRMQCAQPVLPVETMQQRNHTEAER